MQKSGLVELEDQEWFPGWMRQYQIDFLGEFSLKFNLYGSAIRLFGDTRGKQAVDMASGNGNSARSVYKKLDFQKVQYTDKYPDNRFKDVIALDVLSDTIPSADVYTMFNGLHHFSKAEILTIIKKINGNVLFIEPLSPGIISLLKVFFATLLLPFFLVPFTRPFRWDRIIITYIIPIGPIICMRDLVNSEELSHENFEVGRIRGPFTALNYLKR